MLDSMKLADGANPQYLMLGLSIIKENLSSSIYLKVSKKGHKRVTYQGSQRVNFPRTFR